MATTYQFVWDDEDLIKTYEVAVQLGTRTYRPSNGLTSTCNEVAVPVEGELYYTAENSGFGWGDGNEDTVVPLNDTQVYTTYFDPGWIPCEEGYEAGEEEPNNTGTVGESIYFAEAEGYSEDPVVQRKGKGKKKKGKQVSFTGTESQRESGWDKTEAAADYEEDVEGGQEGEYYNPEPTQTPDWTRAFPRLTVPPLPSSIPAAFRKGDMSSLLMSWYMCGYHSGYFDAKQDMKRQAKLKK